jgi:cytochrome bd ubiquinol oxidase subunit II
MDLQTVWFILVAVLLTGYAVLDGFDLGVGILHTTVKKDAERRTLMGAIGPVWDGNEVWLVTGGGALFASFPHVYATVFSGFYLAFMLFLFALILRAVAMEFRSKVESLPWRAAWDLAFSAGSGMASLLLGVAFGNVVRGIPLSADYEFAGTFFSLLNPFALMFGVASVCIMALHGSLYLVVKTEGDLGRRMGSVARMGGVLIPLFVLVLTGLSVSGSVPVHTAVGARPLLLVLPLLAMASGASIPFLLSRDAFRAFLASCFSIVSTLAFFFSSLYPTMVFSLGSPGNSLTVMNASSSPMTLKAMGIIACIGLPLVLFYTVWVHRVFKGKVTLDPDGY